jgi:hypothetical protein
VILEYFTPLARIPGQKLTWLATLRAMYRVFVNQKYNNIKQLHEKYGPIIRLGTNMISVSSAEAVRTVYMSYRFPKGPDYSAFHFLGPNILSTQ